MRITKTSTLYSPVLYILFMATLLAMVSCNGQSAKTETNTRSKVSRPTIDIHTAVVTGNIDALKQHIAAGSNLNEKDPFGGSSPLISATVFGKTEEARLLIEAGANLNFQNNDGSTALHTAAFFCRPEIVKMLLEKGADKTIRNKYNATPYETVAAPFAEAKSIYDMMVQALGPMGLKLDYAYIDKTRPQLAAILK